MTIDLDRIESLAREVPPGPWVARNAGVRIRVPGNEYKIADVTLPRSGGGPDHATASYLAALDPDTVRALCRIAKAAVAYQEAALPTESLAYLLAALRAAGLIPSGESPNNINPKP